jgi:hypothetical protein
MEVDILEEDILEEDILEEDILEEDILEEDILEEDTSQLMVGTFLLMMYRSGEVILAEEGMEYLVVQVKGRLDDYRHYSTFYPLRH